MSPKATGVLALVLAALCGGYWLMHALEDTQERRAIEAKRLFQFDAAALRTLEVAPLDAVAAAAERDGPEAPWRVTAPHAYIRANQIVWNRVAKALAELKNERTLETADLNLADYGLDEPELVVTGATADGTKAAVAFGLAEPTQVNRYARLAQDGSPVFLVSNDAFFELNRSLTDLRERFAFDIGEEGVTRFEFAWIWQDPPENANPPDENAPPPPEVGEESLAVVIERDGDGGWRMTAPAEGPANEELVERFVKEFQFAAGRAYVDEPEALSDYGLDPPFCRITMQSGAGPRQTLYLGDLDKTDEEGALFVKRADAPTVFIIDSHVVLMLPETIDAFREARLLTRQARNLERVRFVTSETDVTLENDPDAGWQMAAPAIEDVSQEAVSTFISGLKRLRAVEYLDHAARPDWPDYGLDQPGMAFELEFAQGAPTRILIGGLNPAKTQYYAVQDTGQVVAVPASSVQDMRWTDRDFRARRLLRFPDDCATRAHVRIDGQDYHFEYARDRWRVLLPKDHLLESQSDMQALLDAVNPCYAEQVETSAAPADLAPYGLDQPVCTVSIAAEPKDCCCPDLPAAVEYGPLTIGAVAPDNVRQRFAHVKGRDEIFRVPQRIVDDLRAALEGVRPK